MSGGVDSSVVAALLAQRNLAAFGITLAMWPASREQQRDRGCCSIDAVEDARRVATSLDLPHYVWNLEQDFERSVIDDFVESRAAGVTLNPCVQCNQRVKFGLLLERAVAAGATHLATGHYAQTSSAGGECRLHRSRDLRRDQSYVLHRLDQQQLSRAVFPLGAFASKQEVRATAAALGLGTARKPESQDLCFVERTLNDELRRRLGSRLQAGPVVDSAGRELGTHGGLALLTVGQRSGLSIANHVPDAAPRYVIELRAATNTAVVGERARLAVRTITAARCSWISGSPPAAGSAAQVQLRAHGAPLQATIDGVAGEELRVGLDQPAMQAAPGQALVVYAGDRVLGGGVIVDAA